MEKTGREGQEGDNEVVEGRYKIKKDFLSFFFFEDSKDRTMRKY